MAAPSTPEIHTTSTDATLGSAASVPFSPDQRCQRMVARRRTAQWWGRERQPGGQVDARSAPSDQPARLSTAEGSEVLDRQLDAPREAGCERVFEDHA